MYCKNCGNKSEKGETYCVNCGNKLIDETNNNQKTDLSLVLGIFACIFFCIPFISIPLAIISIVTNANNTEEEGKKKKTGMILGIISLILTITAIILTILAFSFIINSVDDVIDDYQINDIIENYRKDKSPNTFKIIGNSWKADDNSMLYLNNDNKYIWYLNDNNHEDNYYEGNFKTYNGRDAIKYIATYLKEFGITEEEQENLFEKGAAELSNYYLLILTCEKTKLEGKEEEGTDNIAYYYGFYSSDNNRLEFTNIKTNKKVGFTLNKKLSDIDI